MHPGAPLPLARVLAAGPIGRHRLPGSTIGPYVVEAELGRGAFGLVVRARPRAGGPPVAVKVLSAGADASANQRRRFEREGVLGEAIVHPNVVPVLDAGEEEGLLWIALELVEGRTLREVLEEAPPPDEVVRLLRAVADGVAAAHARGVIHRDLKPDNVLVRARDGAPLLTDFGLARDLEARSSLTKTGALVGTPAYMAPEQIKGKPASMATDVFALGAMLYEGLAGKAPFSSHLPLRYAELLGKPPPPPSSVRPGAPPALDGVVMRALAVRPEDRPPDAGAFRDALDAALRPGAAPTGRGARAPLVAALGLLVGAVAGALLVAARLRDAPPPADVPVDAAAIEPPPPPPTVDDLWARARALDGAARRDALRAVLEAAPGHAGALKLWDAVRAWERVVLPEPGPGPRDGAARLVWDPGREALLLFGGWSPPRIFDDLWAWDGARWTPLTTAADQRPPPRHGHALAWDAARGRLVLHGGLFDGGHRVTPETWEWDGARWERQGLIAGPEARCWQGLEWDPSARAVTLIGGRVLGPPDRRYMPQDDLWTWTGETWRAHQPARPRPGPRWAAGVASDPDRRRVLVFGGNSAAALAGDLWAWSDGEWRELPRGPESPEARECAGFVVDSRGRAVLFGGIARGTYLGDTWLLDLATNRWTPVDPPAAPPPRGWHAMGHDPVRRCVVVYGGHTAEGRVGDLWVLPDLP
ncbi:MAG: protein kinase [Planctomycetes bacterium]|nr:protein kinase [Planctomycetota bacterium]